MKIVLVTWFDAYSKDDWHSKAELVALLEDQPKGQITVTPGILYQEDASTITLIQSVAPESSSSEASYSGILVIPKGMVSNIEVWKELEV